MRTVFIVVLSLLITLGTAAQNTYNLGDVRFTALPVEDGNTTQGYADFRCLLHNSGDEDRSVTVRMESYGSSSSIEKRAALSPRSTMRISIPCPPMRHGRYAFNVQVHETGNSRKINTAYVPHQWSQFRNDAYRFLVLAPLDSDELTPLIKPAAPTAPGRGGSTRTTSLPPEWENCSSTAWKEGVSQMSDIWQGLIRFNAIALTIGTLDAAPPRHKQALMDFVLAGGTLLIFGTASNPLEITPLNTESKEDITWFECGFGSLALIKQEAFSDVAKQTWQSIADRVEKHGNRVRKPRPLEVHREMPVVSDITIPLRSTFLLMLIFAILAGPVMVYVLGRRNRRIMLNWTIPALSLLTSAILVIYAFVSEGITPHVRLSGITALNQIDKTAVTLGTQGYYTPFIPSQGLLFSTAAEITKFYDYYYSYRSNNEMNGSLDLTSGQNLSDGWLKARVPEYFACRTVERRRERIDFTRTLGGESLTIVNGLGADIRELSVLDLNGKVFKAANIKAGEERKLEISPDKLTTASTEFLISILGEECWLADSERKKRKPPASKLIKLKPGTYLAELNSAPFMENGLNYKKCKIQAESVIFGIWEVSDGR